MEDQEILKQFANPATSGAAYYRLVQKYQQKVYWHIRKMVIDHDDANDLTQEVFIKAWKGLAGFRQDAQLFTWLYRIATNECLRFLAAKKRRFFLPIVDVNAELTAKLESNLSPDTEEVELKLQKALLTLPEKQRLVFNMRYYDELSYEQISEILGTSVGALKASYHHAAKKIEAYIKNA